MKEKEKGKEKKEERKRGRKKKSNVFSIIMILAIIVFLGLVAFLVYERQEREVPFKTIAYGQYSGVTQGEARVVQYDFELQKLWDDAFYVFSPRPEMPNINLKNTTVAAFFLGEKNGTGWQINVTNIIETKDRVIISVKQIFPSPYNADLDKITYPFKIIEFRKTEKVVAFRVYN